jgi:hypothetical protein
MSAAGGRRKRRLRNALLALVILLLIVPVAGHTKDTPSTCADVCDVLTASSCTITTVHDVAVGSKIECTNARDIAVNGGELRVHDGVFSIGGRSLTMSNGGKITADCPQSFSPIGFEVTVADDIVLVAASQAKLSARCGVAGGFVSLIARDGITIDALGIDVNGTAAGAPGGSARLSAGGTVSVRADVTADATQGVATGGNIYVGGTTVDIQAELRAKGFGTGTEERPGGLIELEADGDVTVMAGGGLNVGSGQGSGGHVAITAGGVADVRRPVRAWGTGGSIGRGGSVEIVANQVKVDTDVTATGGRRGGRIVLDAGTGGVTLGTAGSATLDVTGGNNERGGTIHIAARGGHVTLGGSATLHVTGGSGAEGGRIGILAEDVTTNAGTRLYANGATPDRGGEIEITGRGVMTLSGTMDANNQGSKTFVYRSTAPTVSPSITGYQLVHMPQI